MKRSQIGPQYIHKRHLKIWILLIIFCIFTFIFYHHYQQTEFNSYPVRGVSIDQQDGYLDFFSLANTGQKFIYIRATQGSIYSDDNFNNNYQRSMGANMLIGVYHVFSFNSNIHDQELNFNREVSGSIGSMPIGIKINSSNAKLDRQQLNNVSKFIQNVELHYDRLAIIWTTYNIYNQIKTVHPKIRCLLWLNGSSLKNCSKYATLIELRSNESLNLDGQSDNVTQSAFNGNKNQWNHFVQNNVDRSNQN